MIHFETVWEAAEEIAQKQSMSKNDIFLRLEYELKEYSKLENIPSKEIQTLLKTKKMGEILFMLCYLTKIDNINSYSALQTEININQPTTQS